PLPKGGGLVRPDGLAGRIDTDAPQAAAGSDEQRFQVVAAEGTVGGFIAGNGDEPKQLAGRREDIDAGCWLVLRFVGRVLAVPPPGGQPAGGRIEVGPVGAAGALSGGD